MNPRDLEAPAMNESADEVTRYYVEEYLIESGYTWTSMGALCPAERDRIMQAASAYAVGKLSAGRNQAAIAQMLRQG